jgi:hypothetical protein
MPLAPYKAYFNSKLSIDPSWRRASAPTMDISKREEIKVRLSNSIGLTIQRASDINSFRPTDAVIRFHVDPRFIYIAMTVTMKDPVTALSWYVDGRNLQAFAQNEEKAIDMVLDWWNAEKYKKAVVMDQSVFKIVDAE